jgi:hypothetical protein
VSAALDAVQALRARHGPNAVLRLLVVAPAGETAPARLRLLPRDEALDAVEIPADGTGRIDPGALPRDLLRDGVLLLNRKARLVPEVRTPGQPPRQVRLGDFRLQCAAAWALEGEQIPRFIRVSFALAGGACNSSRIAMFLALPERAVQVELVEGERRLPISLVSKGAAVRLPLHDQNWSDEAQVIWQAP